MERLLKSFGKPSELGWGNFHQQGGALGVPGAFPLPLPSASERAVGWCSPTLSSRSRAAEGTPLLLQCRAECRLQKTKDIQTLQNQVWRLEGRIRAQPGAAFALPSVSLWPRPFQANAIHKQAASKGHLGHQHI